jgi:transposase
MSHQNLDTLQELIASASSMHHNATHCTTAADDLNKTPDSLNEKKRVAIELLASGKAYTTVAKKVGVDRCTVYRWRQDAEFQERLTARIHELWGEQTDRLKSMVEPSLEVLAEHLEDRYDRARFRAASVVLRLAKLGTINERAGD